MKKKITNKTTNPFFKPEYHLSAPYGWINDPNGFCFFQGKIHLFYQYNPHSTHWGKMHWGHATTSDFGNWEDLGIALYPDSKNDNFLGCFSGSAIEKDGELNLLYTGVPFLRQIQCLAKSKDGITFNKHNTPVIGSNNRPPKSNKVSFRDPKVLFYDGAYYCVIGASFGKGRQIALYKSLDLISWEFVSPLKKEDRKTSGIFECPDLIIGNGSDILIYSIMNTENIGLEYQNIHSSVFEIGKADLINGTFTPIAKPIEFDSGTDFYAPQTTVLPDGRIILVAWMQMWFRSIPTSYLHHGYAGMMTLPREISVVDNKLFQKPAREIYSLFTTPTTIFNKPLNSLELIKEITGNSCYILLKTSYDNEFSIALNKTNKQKTIIDYKKGLLTFNRKKSGYEITGKDSTDANITQLKVFENSQLTLQIFVDKSSIEIFVNDRQTMSNTYYPFTHDGYLDILSNTEKNIEISFAPLKAKE